MTTKLGLYIINYMMNNNPLQSVKGQGNSVQAVERAIRILQLVAESESPISIADLTEQTKMNRTTIWRLLVTLENLDFIERDPITKGYQLGYAASRLVLGNKVYEPFVRRARPSMERLRDETNETVLLSVPKQLGILTIDQIDAPHSVRVVNYVNSILPPHCTSNGKVLLSYLSEEELDIFLANPLEKITPNTITNPKQLKEEILAVRDQGFGITIGELDESENGISVPIIDKGNTLIGFLSVSGPNYRLVKDQMITLAPRIIATAEEIASNLDKNSL